MNLCNPIARTRCGPTLPIKPQKAGSVVGITPVETEEQAVGFGCPIGSVPLHSALEGGVLIPSNRGAMTHPNKPNLLKANTFSWPSSCSSSIL
jgi:hypothetical protein